MPKTYSAANGNLQLQPCAFQTPRLANDVTFRRPVLVECFGAAILDGSGLRMYDPELLLLGWKAAPYCLSLLRNCSRCRHGGYAVIICGLLELGVAGALWLKYKVDHVTNSLQKTSCIFLVHFGTDKSGG